MKVSKCVSLCQQIYENITMSREGISAEAMRDCVEYQWFTMIKKIDAHMTGSQEVTGSIPLSSTREIPLFPGGNRHVRKVFLSILIP